MPLPIEHFHCPNPKCPDHKTGRNNLALYRQLYGRKQVRLFICNTCGKTFSELRGTPFWDSRLDWEEIEKIFRSLLEEGIRATAHVHHMSKNTVRRYLRLAAKNKANFEAFASFLKKREAITNRRQLYQLLLKRCHNRVSIEIIRMFLPSVAESPTTAKPTTD